MKNEMLPTDKRQLAKACIACLVFVVGVLLMMCVDENPIVAAIGFFLVSVGAWVLREMDGHMSSSAKKPNNINRRASDEGTAFKDAA